MKQVHSFVASNSIGGIGEALFYSLVSHVFPEKEIEDVTKIKKWQKSGIDFIVDGVYYDVKFDIKANATGNLALETISKSKNGVVEKEGWVYTSKADCVVYVTLVGLDWAFYFFTKPETLNLAKKYKDNKKSVYNYGYESEVILVPKNSLENKKIIFQNVLGEEITDNNKSIFSQVHDFFLRRKK